MRREELVERVRTALQDGRPAARGRTLAPCPFCEERDGKADRHGKLCVWPSGYTRCYRCGTQTFLDGHAPEGWEPEELPDDAERPEPPEGFCPLYGPDAQLAHAEARRYLEERRGLDPATLCAAGVGATLEGRYRERVVVPVLDSDTGEWLTFVARDFTGSPRVRSPYLTASPDDGWALREQVFFNEAALDASTSRPVVVVEGVFDALWLWPDAVAALGELTEWQVRRLARARRPVVTAGDGDAWRKGLAVAERLKLLGARSGALRLPPGTDPDELPREDVFAAALSAVA